MGDKPNEYAFFSVPIKVSYLLIAAGFFVLLCIVLGAYKLGDINRLAVSAYTQVELQRLQADEARDQLNERLSRIEAKLEEREK